MKLARTIQSHAVDAALLRAVPLFEALPRPSRVPLSLLQQRLWFLSRLAGGSEPRQIQMGLRLREELDEAALQSTVDVLVMSQQVLRITFGGLRGGDGEPFQRIGSADVGRPLKRGDLTTAADVEATLTEPMRLEAPAVISEWLVRLVVGDHVLLIDTHHMVSDDPSRRILTRELSELYATALEGRADRLTPLPMQYADYAVWQRQWLAVAILERQSEYWLRILADAPAVLELLTDRPRPAQQDYSNSYVKFVLHKPLIRQLKALSRRHHDAVLDPAGGLGARTGSAIIGSGRAGDRHAERQSHTLRDRGANGVLDGGDRRHPHRPRNAVVGAPRQCHLASAGQGRRQLRASGHAVQHHGCAAVCVADLVEYCLASRDCVPSGCRLVLDLRKLRTRPRSGSRSGLAHDSRVGGSHCDLDELARYIQTLTAFSRNCIGAAGRVFLFNKHLHFRRLEGISPLAAHRTGAARGVQTSCIRSTKSERMNLLGRKHQGSSSCESPSC